MIPTPPYDTPPEPCPAANPTTESVNVSDFLDEHGEAGAAAFGWLPTLLQAADSMFPTGAYAHSGGLETLVQMGIVRDAASLGAFLRDHAIPALAWYELPYLGFARGAAQRGDLPELTALDREYGAGKLAHEAREGSAQTGSQRLRTLARLPAPGSASAETAGGTVPPRLEISAAAFQRAIDRGEAAGHAAIVCGWHAHWQSVPLEAAMAAYFYGNVSGFCSAALKLVRIGQEGCQGVLGRALEQAGETIRVARTVSREDAGWSDPVWEIGSMRHERAFARLFIS